MSASIEEIIGQAAGSAAAEAIAGSLDEFRSRLDRIERALAHREEAVWTTEQTAEYLRCSIDTVLKYHREDGLEGTKRGKKYYFRRSHVIDFVTSTQSGRLATRLRKSRDILFS